MNTDASWPDLFEAEQRVLEIQTKLHQWAVALVADEAPQGEHEKQRRRYLNGWWPEQEGAVLFNPRAVAITR
ncbi:MAG: hypothetical protein M0010_06040 [Actinomycetota bacterium]|nr:hypothetical protein [Actinomycetota bacterium]